jgi:hypothetical protein
MTKPLSETTSRIRARRLGAGGLALVALLAAAGCGGGSKSAKSAAPATITKAQFVTRANAICASADPALSAANAQLAAHPSPAVVAAAVRGKLVPLIETQIAQIHALGTPAGDQATVTRLLVSVQTDLKKIKANPMLMVTTDAFADFAKIAHPYGLTACAPLS